MHTYREREKRGSQADPTTSGYSRFWELPPNRPNLLCRKDLHHPEGWMAVTYMVGNGYPDTNVQKAFLKGIPRCTEQYHKLPLAAQEAHRKHRSITVCWLDLANAYRSVHHDLIKFTLHYYHAPPCFKEHHLQLVFQSQCCGHHNRLDYFTNQPPSRVYQGDPLSIIIFNSVMSTLAQALGQLEGLGYHFSNSPRSANAIQYSDDTCLVADGLASCQQLLRYVDHWLEWMGMRAKVPNFHSLAIRASAGRTYDPQLLTQGEQIQTIGHRPMKFLGAFIQIPNDPHRAREHLQCKLSTLLHKVDSVPVTRNQKLLLYKAAVCPRILWELATSADFPITWGFLHVLKPLLPDT